MKSLDVRDVVVRYSGVSGLGDVVALDHVSLTIEPGSFVVALGSSGCGKTTLLNLMAGFLKPTSGSVSFDGRTIEGPSSERGVVFQHGALMPWLNVIDNVAFGLRLRGVSRKDRHDRARAMLRLVHLEGVEDRRIWELSGGMRQRVGVARALTADPDVLLMDEPLGALDALTREQMQELILDVWARTGKSVFFITHGIDEAVFLASKLLVMSPRPGRVVASLDLDFGRQFAAGAKSGDVKSQPEFVATRERVKELIFSSRATGGSGAVSSSSSSLPVSRRLRAPAVSGFSLRRVFGRVGYVSRVSIATSLVLLLLWQLAASLEVVPAMFLPSPFAVADEVRCGVQGRVPGCDAPRTSSGERGQGDCRSRCGRHPWRNARLRHEFEPDGAGSDHSRTRALSPYPAARLSAARHHLVRHRRIREGPRHFPRHPAVDYDRDKRRPEIGIARPRQRGPFARRNPRPSDLPRAPAARDAEHPHRHAHWAWAPAGPRSSRPNWSRRRRAWDS